MTTEQTPKQRARAGVLAAINAWGESPETLDADAIFGEGIIVALDRLCAERYAAGKVEALKSLVCVRTDAHLPDACVIDVEDMKTTTAEAEAEYKAAVAALEADNG